jgi:hypothetical protein
VGGTPFDPSAERSAEPLRLICSKPDHRPSSSEIILVSPSPRKKKSKGKRARERERTPMQQHQPLSILPSCTCGRHFDSDHVPPLDASFVQVLSNTTTKDTKDDSCLNLSQAVTSPTNPPPLCFNCIQRYVCRTGITMQTWVRTHAFLFRFRRNFLTRTRLFAFFGGGCFCCCC